MIKTNDEVTTKTALNLLQNNIRPPLKCIRPKQPANRLTPLYSGVASSVDLDIINDMFLHHLEQMELKIRFCKRITSRQKETSTLMIRLITGDLVTYKRQTVQCIF